MTLLPAVCFTLSFTDRQVLGLLVESMRVSLALSDTQVGLLHN